MKINEVFSSGGYLKSSDLVGKVVRVTIDSVSIEKLDDGQKPILRLVGKEKGLVLNRTNTNRLIEATGSDETDDWAGWSIVLYVTKVDFQGKRVDAIRIDDRPGATRAPGRAGRSPVAPQRASVAPARRVVEDPPDEALEDHTGLDDGALEDDIPF